MDSQESFAFISGSSEILPIPMKYLKEIGKNSDTSLNENTSLEIKKSLYINNKNENTETTLLQNETKDVSQKQLIVKDKKETKNTESTSSYSNRLSDTSGGSSNNDEEEDEDGNEESNGESCNLFSELSSRTSISANSPTIEKQNPMKLDLPPHYSDVSTDQKSILSTTTSLTEEKLPSYSPSLNHLSINFLCHEIKSTSNIELLKIGIESCSDFFIPVICEINSTQINFYKLKESIQSIKHDNYYQYSSYFFEKMSKNMIDPNLNIKHKSSSHNAQHHHPQHDSNFHYQSETISFSHDSPIHSVYNLIHRSDTSSNLSVNDTHSTISKSPSCSSILSFRKKKAINNDNNSTNNSNGNKLFGKLLSKLKKSNSFHESSNSPNSFNSRSRSSSILSLSDLTRGSSSTSLSTSSEILGSIYKNSTKSKKTYSHEELFQSDSLFIQRLLSYKPDISELSNLNDYIKSDNFNKLKSLKGELILSHSLQDLKKFGNAIDYTAKPYLLRLRFGDNNQYLVQSYNPKSFVHLYYKLNIGRELSLPLEKRSVEPSDMSTPRPSSRNRNRSGRIRDSDRNRSGYNSTFASSRNRRSERHRLFMRLDTNAAMSSYSDIERTESNNVPSNNTTTTGFFDNIPDSSNLDGQQTIIRDQTAPGEIQHHSSTEEEDDDDEDDEDRDIGCVSPDPGLDQESFGNLANYDASEETHQEQNDKPTDPLYNSQYESISSNNLHSNISTMENNNIPTILEEDAENADLVSIDSNDDLIINNTGISNATNVQNANNNGSTAISNLNRTFSTCHLHSTNTRNRLALSSSHISRLDTNISLASIDSSANDLMSRCNTEQLTNVTSLSNFNSGTSSVNNITNASDHNLTNSTTNLLTCSLSDSNPINNNIVKKKKTNTGQHGIGCEKPDFFNHEMIRTRKEIINYRELVYTIRCIRPCRKFSRRKTRTTT
ncbi:hypothetical protein B5S32_g4744 [[Candida] boidinii]|nr:hypothetical protein B5S32_g4744 [[Candida] boidinii]